MIVLIPVPTFISVLIAKDTGPIAIAIPAKVKTIFFPLSSRLENHLANLLNFSTALVTKGNKLSVILPKALLKSSFNVLILPAVV